MRIIVFISLILFVYTQTTTYCPQGTFWSGQTCLPCASTDCTCSSYGQCNTQSTCVSGQAMSSTQGCVDCPTGCSTCTLAGTAGFQCQSCEDKFQLIQGACISLYYNNSEYSPSQGRWQIQNFLNLNSNIDIYSAYCQQLNPQTGLCDSCGSGAFVNEYYECEYCVQNCASCLSRGTCINCEPGYYWSAIGYGTSTSQGAGSGSCVQCDNISGVATCDSSGNPLTCQNGYYFQSGSPSQCVACSQYCQFCTQSACQTCITGAYLSNNVCTLCPGNTETNGFVNIVCNSCSSNTQCKDCISTYNNVNGVCTFCQSQITNCDTCIVQNGAITCQVCQPGYYQVTTSSITSCSSCNQVNSTYLYCKMGSNGVVTVTQCLTSNEALTSQNLFLINGLCIPNNNACTAMADTTGKCSSCAPGYQLINGACLLCPSSCTTCSQSNGAAICTQCINGYYPANDNSQCLTCAAGCNSCINSTQCTQCSNGYYLNNGICNPCSIANCQSCSTNTTTCQTCMPNFFAYQTSSTSVTNCLLCPPGCSNCQASQGKSCTTCNNGWYRKGDGCFQGVLNCAVFTSFGTCSQCNYGFRLQNGYCLPCVQTINGYVCNVNAAC